MRSIILASQSPRRKELLAGMGVVFETVPSDFEENLDDARTPEEVAKELGLGKALAVAQQYPSAIIIGSDTIVTIDGAQLAKPSNEAEARETLRRLSDRSNFVTTSLAVVCLADNLEKVVAESVEVHFKPYDEAAVEAYLATGDYHDKAGSYGIQSGAAPLIEYFRGNYDAIVGLPTHLLVPILRELGFENVRPVELEASVSHRD